MALSYDEALDYLYSLINYEVQRPHRYAPEVVSLERPRALLAAFGDPQESYPIIHVAGTKGKGSVCAMCASILQAAGLRVGFYSSPHLQDFRERFRINGELISPSDLASLVERLRPVVERMPGLTWFEVTTAIAFLYFAEARVDSAVIEVGLGGRLDATNIIRAPVTSTITSLSFDHMHLLGSTLDLIAYEKAGIIKPGVPVISAPQPHEPLQIIQRAAVERRSPLTVAGRDVVFAPETGDEYGQSFTLSQSGETPHRYWTPLLGAHQVVNAAVAVATVQQVRAVGSPISAAIGDEAIDAGLRLVNWPGRLEVVRRSPWLVLDAAHNVASAEYLSKGLTSLFSFDRLILVFGALSDKDVSGMFKILLPITSHLILMNALSPRAFTTEQLAEIAQASGCTLPVESIPSAQDALARAEALAGPNDLICVTGSLTVIGEARSILGLTPARACGLQQSLPPQS